MKIACIECRQSKVKCEYSSNLGICLQCQKKDKPCTLDPKFKRTTKKKQIQQLQKEISNYKQALISSSSVRSSSPEEVPICTDIHPCSSAKSVENIVLTTETINQLFSEFFTHCHPYLPFTLTRNIDTLFETCPLLFWVICSTTASPELHASLYPHVRVLISQVLLYPARNVEIIQALLISSMWPFPAQSQLSDSSYLISGLAKHIGMQTGLHRPDNAHEYSYRPEVLKSDRRTKQSTWLACHFLDAFHSLRLGIPSTFVEDIHFLSLLENQETPAFLRHVCKAMRLTMTACRAMDDDVTHVTRAEKIKPYLNEFTLLKSTFSPTECPPLETLFLVCQLQLYSFVITEKTHSVHKIDLYHRAEQDAIQLIQIVYANIAEHTRFAPMYIIRSLAYAALILLWIQRSEYAIQKERIFESISTAMTILSTSSRYQKDEPHRALNLLVNFSQSTDIEKSSPVKNRMSATLLYESIRMSRENSREIINKLIESILNDDIVLLNNE